ncbi:hypothetical protein QVD17_04972 [Tagetes erecta]|uniref:J domain-containing protein n=1 Tax=Tagetes erecta TaxID=13708 RepID=A0AAD8PB52_TARER|nr:hypothetical protein QVD17_04972 [Tagetes erecta]
MKGYRDNGGGGGARNKTTVYDDVFGGPPKFGATTLPPRLEDYTEIFQGFHASRGCSIPLLDLPPPSLDSTDDVWFDVQSSKLDYAEVFGGFNGLDFALSYQDLFQKADDADADDSSDDVWTPAQSESLSDESDPHTSLEMNQQVSTADLNHLSSVKIKNEHSYDAEKDFLNGMTNDSQCFDVSGSTEVNNQVLPTQKENEKFFSLADNDLCASKEFGVVSEGKKLKKSLSQPHNSGCGKETYGIQKDFSVGNRPPLSVSDLSLKTQPSHLPPPSRPPPALTSKKGDSNFNSKLKTSKSYAFERMTDDQLPPFFDVEIDASSSAAADAAAMKDAVEQAQAKLKSAKALMDRKKEGLQNRSKLQMKYNVGDKKVKVNENYEKSNGFEGERMKGTFESHSDIARYEVRGENQQNAAIFEPNVGSAGSIKNSSVVFEYFDRNKDSGFVQETIDRSQKKEEGLKEHTLFHKTPNDSDENEMYENLIEIQLKDNDIITVEKLVTESWVKDDDIGKKGDNFGPASNLWVDYDVEPEEATEKENEKELNETEECDVKEFWKSGPAEISLIQSEEEDHDREDERIGNESDNISEAVSEQDTNKTEQTLDCNEKILLEEDKIKLERDNDCGENEKVQTIHEVDCISEENRKLRKESISENDGVEYAQEGIKWDEDESITGEDSEVPDVVFQVDHNEIFPDKGDAQLEAPSEKHEVTAETAFSEKIKETVEQIHEVCEEPFSPNQNDLPGVKVEVRTADVIIQSPMENGKKTSELPSGSKNGIDFTTTKLVMDQNINTATVVAESRRKEERLQRARELEDERLRKLEEERERQIENERLRRIEEETERQMERENERLRELENERLRKIEEERERQIERENKRLREIENERLRKIEEERERQIEKEKDRLRELENEHLRKIEEERNAHIEREKERSRELENERLRKIEEERERQIEREKDRMAVDRATLEGREKAFAETRERAAAERATAELRQRALAEARERLEKACAEARERSLADKVMEGRLRVEKATAEARERAVADKFSYQNTGVRQNSLSSDLASSYSGLRYYQAPSQGEGESPQRCKARLERHQRTADRAAKALAEKNMRDLIAQKEQAERSRLAEGLDAEVKRWSSGKQGNLRALLSTLQYILGPDSGWQPVPLTEVITTAAVKKAYRKATLCVHPDKLQQRGATIQQKYICEKVFDLLKEAWNKFNSEER